MRTHERACGDVVVLDLLGALAPRAVDVGLWELIRDLSRRGHHKVVLNLAKATGTHPFGLSTLLGAMLAARQAGGNIKLLHATGSVDDLQFLVALYDYFEVFEDEREAVRSFRGGSVPVAAAVSLRADAAREVAVA